MSAPTTTVAEGRRRPAARTVASWALRIGLALVFAGAGASKLFGDPAQVELFAEIGAGQWLRFAVGALELAAAVGLLVPRLVVLAAAGLVALMAGATVVNVAVIDEQPVTTLVLLAAAALLVWLRRRTR